MPASASPHDVVFFAYDGMQSLDLTGPFEVFAGANTILDREASTHPRYRLTVASRDGGSVVTESGLSLMAPTPARETDPDTLVLPGGSGSRALARDRDVGRIVADLAAGAERVLTVCTGAFLAAGAGIADGHRVTTHWASAEELARRFPAVDVESDPIHLCDGRLWSSAGVTAGIDLALAVVEHDHGPAVAQTIAQWLVMFLRRPGGQTQFATPLWTKRATAEPMRAIQDRIDADPGADHRVEVLAAAVGLSERHFARRFREEIGMPPGQYLIQARVGAARRELESSGATVDAIARACGLGTAENLRRTFHRHVGASPDDYRARFGTAHSD